jgi:mevalonate kinase
MLYYDDFEVANPLGSKAVIHKIGQYLYYWLLEAKQNILYIHEIELQVEMIMLKFETELKYSSTVVQYTVQTMFSELFEGSRMK